MIIMQTLDAGARKEYIQSRNLSRVIFDFIEGDAECVQYHPKGIPGTLTSQNSKWPSDSANSHDRRHDARAGFSQALVE